nr:immunoglobulin heavy chain junction region [Mus musculus]
LLCKISVWLRLCRVCL